MTYSLANIEKKLPAAHKRAKDQIKKKLTLFPDPPNHPDLGHDKACRQAATSAVKVDTIRQEGVFKDSDWYIRAKDKQDDYDLLIFRAILYLALRGISPGLIHKTALHARKRPTRVTSSGGGGGSWLNPTGARHSVQMRHHPMTISQEALHHAGIPLQDPKK